MLFGRVVDLVDGINGHKGIGIGLAHVVHQPAVLLVVHDGDDLFLDGAIVGTDAFINRGAAVVSAII